MSLRPTGPQPVPLPKSEPIPIHEHAIENLRFIRETMERASSFTAVPGWGGVAMGATAFLAGLIATQVDDPRQWLSIWLIEALLAVGIGIYSLHRKATAAGSSGATSLVATSLVASSLVAGGATSLAERAPNVSADWSANHAAKKVERAAMRSFREGCGGEGGNEASGDLSASQLALGPRNTML